jgi:NAD(P)-dependent dehydrogenase (short-subunit alcohol dehydrogenase family)
LSHGSVEAAGRPEVIVVTGASAGVGRGASVGLIARGWAGLEGAGRDVEAAGGRPLVLPADVADAAAVDDDAAAVDDDAAKVEAAFGPIGVWVNNAMVSVFSPVREMEPEEYRRVAEVSGLTALAQAAYRKDGRR